MELQEDIELVRIEAKYKKWQRRIRMEEIGRGFIVTLDRELARKHREALEAIYGPTWIKCTSRTEQPYSYARKKLYIVTWRIVVPKPGA